MVVISRRYIPSSYTLVIYPRYIPSSYALVIYPRPCKLKAEIAYTYIRIRNFYAALRMVRLYFILTPLYQKRRLFEI